MKKTIFVFLIALSVIGTVEAGATEKSLATLYRGLFAELPDSMKNAAIAVIPFEDKTRQGGEGLGVAEYIIFNIKKEGVYKLVDRLHFTTVLQELDLAGSMLVDSASALKAGKMASAEYLVTGSITTVFGKSRISAKLIDVETTEIISSSTVNVMPGRLGEFVNDFVTGKNHIPLSVFRSTIIPGWGQFYSGKKMRGAASLSFGVAGAGYFVYSIISTNIAKSDRDEHTVKGNSDEMNNVGPQVWEEYKNEKIVLDKDYSDKFDRMQIAGAVCAGIWVLNIIDAAIAGAQLNRNFDLYFSAGLKSQMLLAINYYF